MLKIILVAALLWIGAIAAISQPFSVGDAAFMTRSSTPLLRGLVGYWRLEESSGTRYDSTQFGRHLLPTNTPTSSIGVIGDCSLFNSSSSQMLGVGSNIISGATSMTVAFWMKMATTNATQVAVSQLNSGGNQRAWTVFWVATQNRMTFRTSSDGANAFDVSAPTGSPGSNTWTFVCATHNAAGTGTNGISLNNGAFTYLGANPTIFASTAPFAVGCFFASGAINSPLNGAVDEIGIWNRVLTASEITRLYRSGLGNTHPRFDSGRVGDVFVIAGQSNASGRGSNNQSYSSPSWRAFSFANNYRWTELSDPSDVNTGQVDAVSNDSNAAGSVWPLIATSILSDRRVSIGFVPCAMGGTSITAWQPGADHHDRTTLYGSMVHRALQAKRLKLVLWWQGETDAIASMSQADYYTNYTNFTANVMADLGVKVMPCKLQDSTGIPNGQETPINDAIAQAWADDPNTYAGPDLSDIVSDDAYHLQTNAKLELAAGRWWTAIEAALYP